MARRNNTGSGRRQRTSLRSGFADRHRLRMRQLQARRTRLRGYLPYLGESVAIEFDGEGELSSDNAIEKEPLA
ncbi:hypothetical protein [uncultured Microbulbifer sp.]|uniref:hypothetical protein n=1 Tax=uncultured Microbulbifer sp. TaxID=348147 RepID=UPI0026088F39|nr:hypothetical protein [uncultured Microbulbifer sp.]